MIDNTTLDNAMSKKFTDFSSTVKQTLMNKLSNHTEIKNYTAAIDNARALKSSFAEINSSANKD